MKCHDAGNKSQENLPIGSYVVSVDRQKGMKIQA